MDFFLGEIRRGREDIDWFARSDDAGVLAEGLRLHGYRPVPGPPSDLQLDFSKDGLDNSFTLLDRDTAGRERVLRARPHRNPPGPRAREDLRETGTRLRKTIADQNAEIQDLRPRITRLTLAAAVLTHNQDQPGPALEDIGTIVHLRRRPETRAARLRRWKPGTVVEVF
ncbi:hypothetical protein [Streptomyces sp. NPDC085540]|uniref:hypothetical protein n=1 Tax=Streptomyces sp. NPDC085540 TaxID=3365730 RepID=UPI0037D7D61D